MPHRPYPPHRSGRPDLGRAQEDAVAFLAARLTEELGRLWERDARRPAGWTGPGLAAQVGALDESLRTLRAGRLPGPLELRLLLHAYRDHPAYEPAWAGLGDR